MADPKDSAYEVFWGKHVHDTNTNCSIDWTFGPVHKTCYITVGDFETRLEWRNGKLLSREELCTDHNQYGWIYSIVYNDNVIDTSVELFKLWDPYFANLSVAAATGLFCVKPNIIE